MYKKIFVSLILFIVCISNGVYAINYSIPVWSEDGLVREVSNEALR